MSIINLFSLYIYARDRQKLYWSRVEGAVLQKLIVACARHGRGPKEHHTSALAFEDYSGPATHYTI